METTTAMVKQLREETGAGVMDAKRALDEAGGDMTKAQAILRERGLAAAAKRADRETSTGLIESYIHGGRVGALVEVNCETDFVARTEEFRDLVRNIAMQVAAMGPSLVSPEDRPGTGIEGPDEEVVLLSQPFIRDGSRTVGDMITETVARTGENIRVRRFQRFELGR